MPVATTVVAAPDAVTAHRHVFVLLHDDHSEVAAEAFWRQQQHGTPRG
jgi:hypothetical protein